MLKDSGWKKIVITCGILGGAYAAMRVAANRQIEDKGIDDDNPYMKDHRRRDTRQSISNAYLDIIKPVLDRLLSFGGLMILSPVFAVIAAAVYLDDPGPVFFTQKRIGKDKQYILIHKFRSMKMSAPHDVPTHLLENPEQYITKVGRVLRQTSLDELPQIWDIFTGRMSVIGPRPALWNQDDLVAQREKWHANDVLPGLTGLAQIRGRDELLISDKAAIDGEYVRVLYEGGIRAFAQDMMCFIGTIASILKHDGVVEGGTGSLSERKDGLEGMGITEGSEAMVNEPGVEDYGCHKTFSIDLAASKKVLITGAGSYIGESFEKYAKAYYSNITVDTIDMADDRWRTYDFSSYDAVFHVAGIAHADAGAVSEEEKRRYYSINTDLAIETAEAAKAAGVKQFIFMSSMIIYGESAPVGQKKVIDEHTIPHPGDFYGDSKWRADLGVRRLQNPCFHVAVLRAPMIYGKGSRGNYPILSKIARTFPLFPDVKNQRSMLYIENLCEFVAQLILSGQGGVYCPQNNAYTKTSDMVKFIGMAAHRPVRMTRLINPVLAIAGRIPGKTGRLVNKAFGNNVYDQRISQYKGLEYQKISLKESVIRTEGNEKPSVLILVNHDIVIYNFRLELVERLLADGYEVHISSPYGERIDDLVALGAKYHEIDIDRHGMNPGADIKILRRYQKLIKNVNPVIVLGYTIKPNIYGAIASRIARIPFVANITGLGTAFGRNGVRRKLIVMLYKMAFTNIQRVFFQNDENEKFFKDVGIAVDKHALLPGSGVNLQRYPASPVPPCGNGAEGDSVKFAFISRIMKEKGIEQFLAAAEKVRTSYPMAEFHICGFCEAEYKGRLEEMNAKGIVIYHGMIRDVAGFMSRMHCIVHPTYYPEGLSNVLLEACACGRPIITTDRSGCREAVNGKNGYLVPERNEKELVKAIECFIRLSKNEKSLMGEAGRKLVEEKFSREIVVDAYMKEIKIAWERRY